MKQRKSCETCKFCTLSYGLGTVNFDPPNVLAFCMWAGPMPRWIRPPGAEVVITLGPCNCDTWEAKEED